MGRLWCGISQVNIMVRVQAGIALGQCLASSLREYVYIYMHVYIYIYCFWNIYIFSSMIYKFFSASNFDLCIFPVNVLKLDVLLLLFQRLRPRMVNICINGSDHIYWRTVKNTGCLKFRTWPLICIRFTKTTFLMTIQPQDYLFDIL